MLKNENSTALAAGASSSKEPAMASTLVREPPQAPMSAKERAAFHLGEYARAMAEIMPADALSWGTTMGGDADGGAWAHRFVSYRVPDAEISKGQGPELIWKVIS